MASTIQSRSMFIISSRVILQYSSSYILVASMSEAQQTQILAERQDVAAEWDPEYGDRHTQFVIIGTELDEEKLTKELDACLVNAQEIDADWQQFEDPYQWQIRPAR